MTTNIILLYVLTSQIAVSCTSCSNDLLVLLKALPPVCMKYTVQDESQVANIARGKA